MAQKVAIALNAAWSASWNVIILKHSKGVGVVQSVVYGYSFNNRWLWLNDYTD